MSVSPRLRLLGSKLPAQKWETREQNNKKESSISWQKHFAPHFSSVWGTSSTRFYCGPEWRRAI